MLIRTISTKYVQILDQDLSQQQDPLPESLKVHHINILQIIAQIQNHCLVINAKTLVESTENK